MSKFIEILVPTKEWSDVAHLIDKELIVAIRLVRKMHNATEDGVHITLAKNCWNNTHWIRCMDAERAEALYEKLKLELVV